MECDGLCNVGQTAGSVPSSAGEPSQQGPHSIFATLLKEQDVMPGREVLLLGWLGLLSCWSLGLPCVPSEMQPRRALWLRFWEGWLQWLRRTEKQVNSYHISQALYTTCLCDLRKCSNENWGRSKLLDSIGFQLPA